MATFWTYQITLVIFQRHVQNVTKLSAKFGCILDTLVTFRHILVTFWTYLGFGHILGKFWLHFGHISLFGVQNVTIPTSYWSTQRLYVPLAI